MGKKKTDKEKAEKKEKSKKNSEEKEETGFPEDVDFKRFLGCGG
ncbi:hypothetical protein [Ekhidna sp.]